MGKEVLVDLSGWSDKDLKLYEKSIKVVRKYDKKVNSTDEQA